MIAAEAHAPLDAALALAEIGLRVLPIKPGTKRPPLDGWQERATTDTDTIRSWWRQNPAFGLGIATGKYGDRWLFCLDVDTGIDGRTGRIKEGDESLADLEAEHGALPDTVEGQSGSGGRHLWFWSDKEITNDQAGRLGVDLDLRGVGGQVVCAPTVHPDSGRNYEWVADQSFADIKVADAPRWLIDLITAPLNVEPRRDTAKYVGPPRPGDSLVWPEILVADGATFLGRRMCRRTGHPYEIWARPGADHTSATLYYGGSNVLKVFTPNWPGLQQGATYGPFGFYAATKHDGDYDAAARQIGKEQRAGTDGLGDWDEPLSSEPITDEQAADEPKRGNWQAADLAAALAGGLKRPTPTVLTRDDGAALLYPGKTNTVFGESSAGKTWALYIAAAQLIAAGRHVIILDWEDDEIAYLTRMIALGVPGDLVVANSTYYPIGAAATLDDLAEIDVLIVEHDTALVGIDSTGEAIAAQGWDQDKDAEVAKWMGALPRRWARLGPCVVMLDHMPHAGGREIGSQRKRAGVSGAAYEAVATEPFAKDKAGSLTLKVAKDRGGNYAKGTEQAVLEFNPEQDGEVMRWTVRSGTGRVVSSKGKDISYYQDAIDDFFDAHDGPASKRQIRAGVPGDNAAIDHALKRMVAARQLVLDAANRYLRPTVETPSDGMK